MTQLRKASFYACFGKRIFDLVLTIPTLLLLSPVLAVLAVLVRFKLGSPVLFRQSRPGRDERIFRLIKFRTMTDAKTASGELLSDTERLTPFGSRLRSLSLDELPELFNVLKGEMSLVGPRPLLTRYTPYFTEVERVRFSVLPGITGLAQVSGRNDVGWDERIALDVRYVENLCFTGDLKILLATVKAVFKRDGLQVDPGAVRLDFDKERQLKMSIGETLHA